MCSAVAEDIFGTVSPEPEDIFGTVTPPVLKAARAHRRRSRRHPQSDYPDFDQMTLSQLEQYEGQLERTLAIRKARVSLLDFTLAMHPTLQDPNDWSASEYEVEDFHRVLINAIQETVDAPGRRLIVTIPPRHGKSTLVSKMLPLWHMGRHPDRDIIMATYGEEFAWDFGRNVRDLMKHPRYGTIFPNSRLRVGGGSQGRLHMESGGLSVFVGKGGSITGRGAHLLLLDDLVKDAVEAESAAQRDKDWRWLTRVAMTRLMSDQSSIVLVMTRWHHDDVVGRLTDPENPHYRAEEAKKWRVLDFPALARDNDVLGRPMGRPLWPSRFSKAFLEAQRTLDPHGFSALYQQQPSIEDGDFFKADWFEFHEATDMPNSNDLRLFAVSDHAVGTAKHQRDKTVLLIFGIDQHDEIWLLECFWQIVDSARAVEKMCDYMQRFPLIKWITEKGVINKSIGPFLQRRMRERNVHTIIEGIVPSANKEVRARSIQGMMANGRVHFPRSPWAHVAMQECLHFPHGTTDDFVDCLAYIGLFLGSLRGRGFKEAGSTARRGTHRWQRKQDEFVRRTYGHGATTSNKTMRLW